MKNENLNTVALRRGYIVSQYPVSKVGNGVVSVSLQAEMMRLGFMFDSEASAYLQQLTVDQVVALHTDLVAVARELVGAKRNYRPFYVNFPSQVMEMSSLELFVNAVVHYWSDGEWEPPQELAERGLKFEHSEYRMITVRTEDALKAEFTKLVSINSALTEADKAFVQWMLERYGATVPLPAVVPFKETLGLLASFGLDVPVKTATDVLRIAVFLSDGDPALPGVPKAPKLQKQRRGFGPQITAQSQAAKEVRDKFRFKHFTRGERRYLLGLLEQTSLDTSEMQQRLERWLRLGEILHPGERQKDYPLTYAAFQALRNQPPRLRTFAGQVDYAFEHDLAQGLALLSQRPGEFARRMDWLLRTFAPTPVLTAFKAIAARVSSKVLFELYGHLQNRQKSGVRSVSLKGRGSKVRTLKEIPALDSQVVTKAQKIIMGAMTASMTALEPLGSVWIDERLKQVPIPYGMRGINTAIKTYVRGTRIPFRAEATTIRPFIHWYDASGTEDLDLSAGFLDVDLKPIEHISYTNLKSNILNACHSGDIRHRRGSCAEYVDVDIEIAVKRGVRYVAVQVLNFNGRPMHTLKECYFGLMERQHPKSNEIFDPRTVSNTMTLANESTTVLICVIDLIERCYVWMDVEINRALAFYENTKEQTVETVRAILEGNRLSVYDLLAMHATARGKVVARRAKATTVFTWEEFVTDYAKSASYMTFV